MPGAADRSRCLVSVHHRHLHVHQDQIVGVPVCQEFVQGCPAVFRPVHRDSDHLQQLHRYLTV